LLGLLRLHGPSTATKLGELVGESSGSTSYHLRQLADHGFVEDAGGLGTGRERWWRARHLMTSWQLSDLLDQEEGEQVQDEMTRLQIAQHGSVLQAWMQQRKDLGREWVDAASLNDYALRLTPVQARELADELFAVLDRWHQAHPAAEPAPDSELVSVLLDVVPLKQWPT
jgi:DNA-binding transcriptional ArsR family regulator